MAALVETERVPLIIREAPLSKDLHLEALEQERGLGTFCTAGWRRSTLISSSSALPPSLHPLLGD